MAQIEFSQGSETEMLSTMETIRPGLTCRSGLNALRCMRRAFSVAVSIAAVCILSAPMQAQEEEPEGVPSTRRLITKKFERMQMIANTSQVIALNQVIDTVQVYNDTIIYAKPTSRSEILISAMATGVSQIDLKTRDNETYSLEIVVTGDARELKAILAEQFPSATLEVMPIQEAVIISGQVTADEHVEQVVRIAEQYYENVINRVEVIGVHTIMLHTQVMEVSRTKLRELGVDWASSWNDDGIVSSVSGLIAPGGTGATITSAARETVRFEVVTENNTFFGFIRALKQNNMAKVLADPTVVAIDGRPASFNSGGEFPILVPAGMGQVGVEFREYGTRLDFVAKVRGDGRIWLEVRPMITEIDPGRTVSLGGVSVPGLRSRFVETAVELKAGETLALAGLLQMRTESETVGIPWVSDVPYLGALFRRNREIQNEVELLIMVTPNFAGPMQPEEVPCGGPGYNSTSPLDSELYGKGYIEVPNTSPPMPQGTTMEMVQPGTPGLPTSAPSRGR